jgi:hypothetical protein
MRAVPFDRIVTANPIDRTANTVVSRGTRYEPEPRNKDEMFWSECPELVDIPADQRTNPEFVDLVGWKVGAFRVIGYMGGGKWACMCVCGRYVRRRAGSITKPKQCNDGLPMCPVCENTRRVRSGFKSLLGKKAE